MFLMPKVEEKRNRGLHRKELFTFMLAPK
uniref:Uncharacterized protein n=1 Tax=Rhizophora mucronata TaxID=61149 RepID=A0A2P2QL99_RHIMU